MLINLTRYQMHWAISRLNANRSLLDPKQYEGFTVKIGKETSQNGGIGWRF